MAAVSLEELVKVYKVSVDSLSKSCSDEHLTSVSNFLDWRATAPRLGLKEEEIDAIEHNSKTEEEKSLKTLQKWRAKYNFRATYKRIISVLLELGRADHAEKVCRLLGPTDDESINDRLLGPTDDESIIDTSDNDTSCTTWLRKPTIAVIALLLLVYPVYYPQLSKVEKSFSVDLCSRMGAKGHDWTVYACIVALDFQGDPCFWLKHQLNGEGWMHHGQTIFQFAPNCHLLEYDEEAAMSAAAKQGYELLFAGMTTIQRAALEEMETPMCIRIRLRPKESTSKRMWLNVPLKCTHEYNTKHQCNLTLTSPSFVTDQKIPGVYTPLLNQRPKMRDFHMLTWEEKGQRKTLNIISKIAYKWKTLGRLFGFQEAVLSSIEVKELRDHEECCYAVIQKWRESGSEEYPVTWGGFIKVLEGTGFQILADDLRTILPKKK